MREVLQIDWGVVVHYSLLPANFCISNIPATLLPLDLHVVKEGMREIIASHYFNYLPLPANFWDL
jgi:hypothetical protein